jgi:hypothetical protein
MNYTFDVDMWYVINETTAGKLEAGLQLGTIHEPQWFNNEQEWKARCEELEITENNTTFDLNK